MKKEDILKNIKDCRDALLGKVTQPVNQVEQITLALIYKFMDDIDQESIDMGGKATYFSNEYKKYSWKNIMQPNKQIQEKYNLYSEGIEKFKTHPDLSDVFRKVFKDAFLPYRDATTLVNFLNIINRFNYDDSEVLGEAYENLLNITGASKDAGQFRTPRHIIDFIIDILEPTKMDTILDPACGTAGFLISAFKYITKQKLTPQEKQKLSENFSGYEIDPTMAEISAVNLYLHDFKTPKIYEYDTLSSVEKWREKFDIILANPPFMTPKGGIQPHNLFELKTSRAEVLFSEYILEHLKSDGRAGFIVPSGIIARGDNAYKTLRKNLLNGGLYGIIKLPNGVFQPYTSIETFILLIDKSLKMDNVLFIEVINDGFDFGTNRNPIEENDLPNILEKIRNFRNGNLQDLTYITKQQLLEKDDFYKYFKNNDDVELFEDPKVIFERILKKKQELDESFKILIADK
jgi:type I restriction enzyme M protein